MLLAFLAERKLFIREYANKTYGAVPYYLSKTLVELPVMILMPIIFIQIVYYGSGLTITLDRILIASLTMVLLVFFTSALGFLIGTAVTNESVAQTVAPLILIPSILFAGFFFNLDSTYVWLRWLQYLSPIRYAMEVLIRNEFDNNDRYDPRPNFAFAVAANMNEFVSPADQLGYKLGIPVCLLLLGVLGVVMRVMALVALKLNAK